jgi:hypothetical protein
VNRNRAKALLPGAMAGLAGGAAMALMRMTLVPRMPKSMRPGEFVPKKAVEWAEDKAGRPEALSEPGEMRAGMAAHFAYSALTGSIYGLARPAARRFPAPLAGALYGLLVWGASFEGWAPALGVMERTTEKPLPKWIPPLMGHMVYGAVTGLVFEALERRGVLFFPADDEATVEERKEQATRIQGVAG